LPRNPVASLSAPSQAPDQTRWRGTELRCPGGVFCQLPIPFEQGDSTGDIALELTKATLQGTKDPDLAVEGRVRGLTDVRLEHLAFTLACLDSSGKPLGDATHELLSVAPVGLGDTTPFRESVKIPAGTMRIRLVRVRPELTPNPPHFDAIDVEPTWKAPRPVNATLRFRIRGRNATDREVHGVLEVENQGPATLTSLVVELRNAGGKEKHSALVAASIFPPMLPGERRISTYSLQLNEDVGKEELDVIEAD